MYITASDLAPLVTLETALATQLIGYAESLFNDLVGGELISSEKTEWHDYDGQRVKWIDGYLAIYPRTPLITAVTSINGVAIASDRVQVLKNRVLFKDSIAEASEPRGYSLVYTSGFSSNAVPSDIKMAICYLVNALNTQKSAEGIGQFRQDLLTVTYKEAGTMLWSILSPNDFSFIKKVVSKYRTAFVYTS